MSQGIGRTIAESTPSYTTLPTAPAGAPNVVVIVLDDLGFAQLGCFGGDVPTPTIDRLAQEGLRFNRFHVTSLCSPTRASLLTGRNHHAVGMGFLTDIPTGFPGYTGRIPLDTPTMPKLLRDHGYSAYAVGKWHLAPRWEQSASGPFDRWPLGLGFERFYGFLGGDTNQWTPALVSDNGFVDPPRRPEDGYHLTEDLVDRAIGLVRDQRHATPDKPFLLWLATGAMHAPHQAPQDFIDRFAGQFDDGWDVWRRRTFDRQVQMGVVPRGTTLTERPSWVQDWDALPPAHRKLFSRMMEVFAGFLAHTDAQLARLVSFLEDSGLLDDTVVMVLSDNGTSAEGGPTGSFNEHRFVQDRFDEDLDEMVGRMDDLGGFRSYGHYPWGWAWAGNTPLRLWKRYTWLGGVRTPLVVRWPAGIADPGAVRSQFCHAVDVLPTVLDAVGASLPPGLDGRSLIEVMADPDAASPRTSQYFEMLGSRAMYGDGWKATTDHVGQQLSVERELLEGSSDYATDRWSLFDLSTDFSESTDVAAEHPDVVARLTELWWAEAGRNHVLPLDDSFIARAVAMEPSPNAPRFRTVIRPGPVGVAEDLLPGMGGGFRLIASLDVDAEADGVICALGDWSNGFALYLLGGRVVAAVNLLGDLHRIEAAEVLAPGPHDVVLGYHRSRATGRVLGLWVDGEVVTSCELRGDLPFRWQIGGSGLHVGHDVGFPVCDDYQPPAPCTATLHQVVIEIPRLAPRDPDAEVASALKHE